MPFIGSGVSISAGYPTIRLVTQYLAKVSFAIDFGIFRKRFPIVKGSKESLVKIYRQHPSKYLEDFGWPDIGQLDAELWNYVKENSYDSEHLDEKSKQQFSNIFGIENDSNHWVELRQFISKHLDEEKEEDAKKILESAIGEKNDPIHWVELRKFLSKHLNEEKEEDAKKILELAIGEENDPNHWVELRKFLSKHLNEEKGADAKKILESAIGEKYEQTYLGTIEKKLREFFSEHLGEKDKKNGLKILTTEIDLHRKGAYKKLDTRDYLNAIVQWVLRQELVLQEAGTKDAALDQWYKWKRWYHSPEKEEETEPKLLFGDWEMLLDKLCEGNFDLTDTLFSQLEKGLSPAISHRLLAFLQLKLGIPLIFTTNFDSLLERAFRGEGLRPAIFDIHKDAELPTPDLVHRQLSIIKLHGSAYGLRFGERLKQKLEINAENNAKQYLPKNALILVFGFSGSERRMMQMLQAFVNNSETNEGIQLIWIQGPSDLSPMAKELTELESKKVKWCKVKHADTFLQELYFNIANSHQSSNKSYSSLPGQLRMTELKLELPPKPKLEEEKCIEKADKRRPVQCFVANQEKGSSGSWATLAGVAFTNSLDPSYTVIWIDLENHQSVQGVIAEIFYKVRVVDPLAPSCNVTDFSVPDKKEKELPPPEEVVKIIDRIKEIFQRGRFVLVLDSLESFCRPALVHHGIPTHEDDQETSFKSNLVCFYCLLNEIVKTPNKEDIYLDSYIVITIDKPRSRHHKNNDKALSTLNQFLPIFIKNISNISKEISQVRLFEQDDLEYSYFIQEQKKTDECEKDKTLDLKNFTDDFSEYWRSSDEKDEINITITRSLNRAESVLFLLKNLCSKTEEELFQQDKDKDNVQSAISALVSLLAFFRQPRTIPMLHSIIQRWVLDIQKNIEGQGENTSNEEEKEEKAEQIHEVIARLLDLITGTTNNVDNKENENRYGNKFTNISADLAPIVAQKHEGGSIWLYREIHEQTYNALTETIHRTDWGNGEKDDKHRLEAILDGMLAISWHLLIARTYYVDIFLPTKDINAFYEYLYHRVTAIRTMTLLLKIISETKDLEKVKIEKCDLMKYTEIIGVFSQTPQNQQELTKKQNSLFFQKRLIDKLKKLHQNSIITLLKALKRNQLVFLAQSTPETVLAWSNQFLGRELDEISGKDLDFKDSIKLEEDTITKIDDLEQFFIKLQFSALMAKFDFEEVIKKINKNKNININGKTGKKIGELFKKEIDNLYKDKEGAIKKINEEIKGKLKKSCDQFMRLTHSLLYQDYRKASELAKYINETICEDTIIPPKIKESLKQESIALKGRSLMAQWPFWQPLLDRKLPGKSESSTSQEGSDLSEIEKDSIAYEDTLRMIAETSENDALHRSSAFSLRARALYLQGHFSQAHHYLDIALTGLLNERIDHRVKASVIHLVRAELLATSAEKKYKDCLNNDIDKAVQIAEVNTSLKKLSRACHALSQADLLLHNLAHENIWLITLEFGKAQVQLEQMLFEMELLYLEWAPLNQTEYLKKSGALEQSILYIMQRLRNVLDLIPFDPKKWSKKEKEIKSNEGKAYYSTLVTIERMCYKLWKQLFLAGGSYTTLLSEQYKVSINLGGDAISYTVLTGHNEERYCEHWKHWCNSMRFKKLGVMDFKSPYFLHNVLSSAENELEKKSLRAVVFNAMEDDCEKKIIDMWNARRDSTDKSKK